MRSKKCEKIPKNIFFIPKWGWMQRKNSTVPKHWKKKQSLQETKSFHE